MNIKINKHRKCQKIHEFYVTLPKLGICTQIYKHKYVCMFMIEYAYVCICGKMSNEMSSKY